MTLGTRGAGRRDAGRGMRDVGHGKRWSVGAVDPSRPAPAGARVPLIAHQSDSTVGWSWRWRRGERASQSGAARPASAQRVIAGRRPIIVPRLPPSSAPNGAEPRLRAIDGRFDWDWQVDRDRITLDAPLWPIAFSAVELLTGREQDRIKVCANPDGCGWLFYDGSKNGSRRWCSMEGCGSKVKMRRQYAKRRARDA